MTDTDEEEKKVLDPHYFECKLEIEPVKEAIHLLKSSELLPPSHAFLTNLESIHGLLHIPDRIIGTGVRNTLWAVYFSKTYAQEIMKLVRDVTGALRGESDSRELEFARMPDSERVEQANLMLQGFFKRQDSVDRIAGLIHSMFEELASKEEFRESLRILLMSSTAFLWTAFECLAADCWVATLNSGSTSLAHRAFRGLPPSEEVNGISSKYIEVAVLARHGFDVKNKLGSILSKKFKFSSLDGIQEAYTAAFQDAAAFEKILGGKDLQLLESSRHLIVHRSGIIDEKFLKRNPTVKQNVAEPLDINGRIVSGFAASTVGSGISLLNYLDRWLESEKTLDNGQENL